MLHAQENHEELERLFSRTSEKAGRERIEVNGRNSSADALHTISSSERSGVTPSLFDPATPKAMSFDVKDGIAVESVVSV
jgi:hypothetical protein